MSYYAHIGWIWSAIGMSKHHKLVSTGQHLEILLFLKTSWCMKQLICISNLKLQNLKSNLKKKKNWLCNTLNCRNWIYFFAELVSRHSVIIFYKKKNDYMLPQNWSRQDILEKTEIRWLAFETLCVSRASMCS